MAEFVRKKREKGIAKVGTKAEGIPATLATKDRPELDLSILKSEVPESLEEVTEAIKESHKVAVGQMGRAVIAAARAGQLLLAAKTKLPKTVNFTDWLAETFEFSQRTAYNYMKVSEAMASRAKEIEQCESIREVLKLLDSESGAKSTVQHGE